MRQPRAGEGAGAGRNAAAFAKDNPIVKIGAEQIKEQQEIISSINGNEDPADFTRKVQQLMWEKAGVVRDKANLQQAILRFEQLRKEAARRLSRADIFASLEAMNLVLTAEMVARAALAREETRSAHIRSDYPFASDKWVKHVSLTRHGDDIKVNTVPVVKR